ncbi:rhamnogalacturonan acetylesterase [Daejeonella sp.]|uniref:rhamnogalacturonan acetylesterase n=1 Tax=Daejeonella sp. TaxID=2805397 RepID=UPI0030C60F1B
MINYSFNIRLFFLLSFIVFASFKLDKEKITIFSIGDSTMADYNIERLSTEFEGDNYPLRGWMMMMPQFFNDHVTIHNSAASGRSSKSFRTQGFWKKVIEKIKPGDYVFIQFGHNDAKIDSLRYTEPRTSFRQNIINYVNEAKTKGAFPVLFTSVVRRNFDSNGSLVDTHGEYVTVIRDLAREMQIPLVDLNKKSAELVQKLGPEESKKLYLWIEPGLFKKLPEGKKDDTHFSIFGATKIAQLATQSFQELGLPVGKYLK